MHEHFLHWTEDGFHLVFSLDYQMWTFNIEHSQGRLVTEEDWMGYGFYADVSPDGCSIVYTACEPVYDSFFERNMDLYEIAKVNVDGSGYHRLTENEYFENYPVWSPDGAEIAFIRSSDSTIRRSSSVGLYIMSAEDGGVRRLYPTERLALYPPVWSPDGQWLAFIAEGEECCPRERVLHTVRSDDSELIKELIRIGETTAPATWSPDGEELAFVAKEGREAVIYAVRADGTGQRTIWRSTPYDPSTPVSQVSWSPDGSEILFTFDHLYVIGSDGSGLRPLGPRSGISPVASWSPDGSRVAIYYVDHLLVTVARDGTDLHELVSVDEEGRIHALDPSLSERPVDLAACSAGRVVREPEANPGLVHDCEVLLSVRDRLGGGVELDWSESTPIEEWEGITLGGEPSRVHELILPRMSDPDKLTGTLPPELGELAELRTLDLYGNYLSGSIPPELGSLMNLGFLDLSSNYLDGSIPPELDNLTNLGRLHLNGNQFTGCIPTALRSIEGDLTYLRLPNCE